jgi:hypothetical protein
MTVALLDILNEEKITTLGVDGTYIAAKFTSNTVDAVYALANALGVDNVTAKEKMHVTIVYSRKPFTDFTIYSKLKTPWKGDVTELEIFETQSGSRALVLRFNSKKLNERHEYFKKEYGATYDFPEYKTHITLSYDVGPDWEIPKNLAVNKLIKEIEISYEYYEPLNNDWAKDATDSKDKKKDD